MDLFTANSSYGKLLKQVDYDNSLEYSKTSAAEITSPVRFSLSCNYPYSFNPSIIEFQIPETKQFLLN